MTAGIAEPPRRPELSVHSDSPAGPVQAVNLGAQVVPEHLLDGGEIILLAIKPSLWFILLVSGRWIAGMALLGLATRLLPGSRLTVSLINLAIGLSLARLILAAMQWSTRLYLLTNRRFLRIRGILRVEVFECPLARVQNTWLTLSLAERIVRVGTITISTAAGKSGGGTATWQTVARPLEIHEKLREAIRRAQNRGTGDV